MKRIIEETAATGLESMLGEKVILLCGNYFYAGKLIGVNETVVELESASIVYETGEWSAESYARAEGLGAGSTFVRVQWIEAFRRGR